MSRPTIEDIRNLKTFPRNPNLPVIIPPSSGRIRVYNLIRFISEHLKKPMEELAMQNPRNPGPQHVDHGDAVTGGKPDTAETQDIGEGDVGNVRDIMGERRKQKDQQEQSDE